MAAQEFHIVLLSKEPDRAYTALMLAMGVQAMGGKASIYCTSGGLEVVRKGGAEQMNLPGFPPLGQMLKDAQDAGVYVSACAPSPEVLKMMGITRETTVDGVVLEDVIGFLNRAMPAAKGGGVVTFV